MSLCEYLLFACLDILNAYFHPIFQVLTVGTKSSLLLLDLAEEGTLTETGEE